jgi:arginase
VLDRTVMPAVDTPGSPGIDPEDVIAILRSLIAAPLCCGATVTIFDPDLDPIGGFATLLVQLLKSVLDGRAGAA